MSMIEEIEQLLDIDLSEQRKMAKTVRLVRKYYQGEHEDMLTEAMKKRLRLADGHTLTANWMPLIIHNMASRINVLSITADDEEATRWATQVLADNGFPTLQNRVHTAAILDGNAYVLVGFDANRQIPTLTLERAFDNERGFFVVYSGEEIYCGVKVWNELVRASDGRHVLQYRVNLYFQDRIERYRKLQSAPLEPIDSLPMPILNGDFLGVPVAHFKNRPLDVYGKSEIEPVIALQDMYNRGLASWLSTIETAGFPNRYAVGWDASQLEGVAPGDWIIVAPNGVDKEQRIELGMIQPGDLAGTQAALKGIARIISNITSTAAPEFFESDSVSGDAQIARQTALLGKCQAFQMNAVQSWAQMMDIAWNVQAAYGTTPPPDCERWGVEFSGIGIRRESEIVASAVQAYSTGALSRRAFLEAVRAVFNLTPADIERILEERNQEIQTELDKKPDMLMASPPKPLDSEE